MKVSLDVDLEKFRCSLVGDGYLKEEVINMSQEKLIEVLKDRINRHIENEYHKSKRMFLKG